jgi:hypothetical protein
MTSVDAFIGKPVTTEFAKCLAELAAGARQTTALAVIEADGNMDGQK